MPRSVRIEYEGAFYHVMARGNRREAIFRDREDRLYFLKALSETCGQTPSLPDADPRSDRPRCGGRESRFLAALAPPRPPHSPAPIPIPTGHGAAGAKANS